MKNESKPKKRGMHFLKIILPILIPILLFASCCSYVAYLPFRPTESYYSETTNIEDYGKFYGNNDNGFAFKFIYSFFPKEIQDNFSDITYSYRSEDFGVYGFEAYLEFTIEDEQEFSRYIASIAEPEVWQPFAYDPSYMEYSIVNELELSLGHEDIVYDCPNIDEAEIGKVLYSPEEQRIIYIALAVYDSGASTTDFLCVFFDRFNIDPVLYLDKQ